MMRQHRATRGTPSRIVLLAMCALICSLSMSAAEAVEHTGTAADLSENGVEFTFAQPMQVWPDDTRRDLVRIDPQRNNICHWNNDTSLFCRFDGEAPLPAATRYRLTLSSGLQTQTGAVLPEQDFVLETARPRLSAHIESWVQARPQIEISSNIAVDAEAVAKVLRLQIGGRLLPTPAVRQLSKNKAWGKAAQFAIDLPDQIAEGMLFTVSVVPGLRANEGTLPGTQQDVLLKAIDRERFRLREVSCSGPRSPRTLQFDLHRDKSESRKPAEATLDCMPGEPLSLKFSQPLDDASKKTFADGLPNNVSVVGWQERGWYGYASDITQRAPGSELTLRINTADSLSVLTLDGSLHGKDNGQTLQPKTLRVRAGVFRPQLRAEHAQMLVVDGATALAVESVNAAPAAFAIQAVGAEDRHAIETTPDSHGAVQPILSTLTTQTLREGGWVRWSSTPNPSASNASTSTSATPKPALSQPMLQFAAPQFDLHAIASRRDVLVWANAWDGSGPIAGADIELLLLRNTEEAPQRMTQARTGKDGIARLRLPDAFALPDSNNSHAGLWLVRAAGDHAQRAVLPLGVPANYGMPLGQREERMRIWGVADRPLYRAGDTVRYRLWQRMRRAGRLQHPDSIGSVDAPVELSLYALDESKRIRSWKATPTAEGALSGDAQLPLHLTDGTYCIGVEAEQGVDGICFFVGTYRAQDLWVQAETGTRLLRDGDPFAVTVSAGYYSGGPASGAAISKITTMLNGLPLSSAYPAYKDYTFVDVMTDDAVAGIALQGQQAIKGVTDAQGKAQITIPVRFNADGSESSDTPKALPAFGQLQLIAEARLSAREATVSNAAQTRYARFDRYVGLRLQPRWFDAKTPIVLSGVVIDAEGRAIDDAKIQVDVDYLPGYSSNNKDDAQTVRLTACALTRGIEQRCDFLRTRSGRYRLTARSGDAAPAVIERYVWAEEGNGTNDKQTVALQLLELPAKRDAPARLLLKQPYAKASVLIVIEAGGALLDHRVIEVEGAASEILLPVVAEGYNEVRLYAYIRARGQASELIDGLRKPTPIHTQTLTLALPAVDRAIPITAVFDRERAAPAQRVHLRLHNASTARREVVVSVIDDATRALAAEWLEYFDPHGPQWLGATSWSWQDQPATASFADWNAAPWQWLLPWPEADTLPDAKHHVRDRRAGGAQRNADAVAIFSRAKMVAPAPTDDISGDGFIADAAGVAPSRGNPKEEKDLDSVTVTGSRISVAEVFHAGPEPQPALKPRDLKPHASPNSADASVHRAIAARLRSTFADTALWQPDITLAPGETREIALTLPDNLTRWRATVWSSDADDGFEMTDATIDSGLPVEVRLQTPTRIYPGDHADLAANVRQAGDTSTSADVMLEVNGLSAAHQQPLPLPARGQASIALSIAPTDNAVASLPTMLTAMATAQTAQGSDAVAATIELASPRIETRKTQAGWLGHQPLALTLPTLPPGVNDAVLQVSLRPGADGLMQRWIDDLHAYPHRCWEQILSRAVAAAIAIERGDSTRWPDAAATVHEALDNAKVFQGENGDFRYFADIGELDRFSEEPRSQVALTAYTARALRVLQSLGYALPDDVLDAADGFLTRIDIKSAHNDDALQSLAFAASALDTPGTGNLDALWTRWSRLSLPAKLATTRALAAGKHPATQKAVSLLRDASIQRGAARILKAGQRDDRWMSSDLREQCEFINLLLDFPALADAALRRSLVAGLTDLYAGGIEQVDTQTGASCLIAIRALEKNRSVATEKQRSHFAKTALEIAHASDQALLQLSADGSSADAAQVWQTAIDPAAPASRLQLTPHVDRDTPASYVAELRYSEDARQATSTAVGLSLDRRYEVLRDGAWIAIDKQTLHDGDWLRITLTVVTTSPRYFVALTDSVAGGLRPTDLALGGIAGLDLQKISDTGSSWFATRRLDPRAPKFYAEYLPQGTYAVHYFARIGNTGDYLAAPAVAELMYGNITRARTAATRLTIAR